MNGIVAEVQGRLSRDPELRYTSQGTAMLALNLAVNDDKRAEDAPTEWVRVTCWGEVAEQLAERLKKGHEVYCHGRLKFRTWAKQDGSQGAGVELSAWMVQPMGAGRRGQHRPKQDAGPRRPNAMPERMAVGAGHAARRQFGPDDDGFEGMTK